jgi:BirA family transcriptional regulator, biotin operon repressor / biotin---[acetyl-CoA-carboxylase] ligase
VSEALGHPRVHLRSTGSTNDRARELAVAGAPHGTLVTASEQTAGRGRHGRAWVAPPASALLMSLVLRDPPELLSLVAVVAVCDAIDSALVKWPNDIVVAGTLAKLGGILLEGRPQERWAVLGIGLNVAVNVRDLPAEIRTRAASLELGAEQIEPMMGRVLAALARRLDQSPETVLDAWRAKDALLGRRISWDGGEGVAEGIDGQGRLLTRHPDETVSALSAGEVHLSPSGDI